MFLVKSCDKYLLTITYLLICFIISIPFNHTNYTLLYQLPDGIPAGEDTGFHAFAVLEILRTKDPLLGMTRYHSIFPNDPYLYPTFLHSTFAIIASIVGHNQSSLEDPALVLEIEKPFMFAVSLAGTAGFALLIKTLLFTLISEKLNGKSGLIVANPRYRLLLLTVSIVAFSFFIFSVSPISQSYNDGAYPQLFAMWAIFPYQLYLLINRRWILSGFLLAIIASSHYFAILIALSATIPYLVFIILRRGKDIKKGLIKFSLAFFVCAIPALIFFYMPVITGFVEAVSESKELPATLVGSWGFARTIELIGPYLYYVGIICTMLLFALNYRTSGWLPVWAAIHFLAFGVTSDEIGARFARDLSVVFGTVIGIFIGYIIFALVVYGKKWFVLFRALSLKDTQISSSKLVVAVILSAIIVPLWYYSFGGFDRTANPLIVKYFSSTIDDANRFFLTLTRQENNSTMTDDEREVIVLFGHNPWLKVTTFGKFDVLPVSTPNAENVSKGGDLWVDSELYRIYSSPTIASTACVLKKYDVDFIYLSDKLPGRAYSPEAIVNYEQYKIFQSVVHSPFFKLEKEFLGKDNEYIRIFSMNKNRINAACNSL